MSRPSLPLARAAGLGLTLAAPLLAQDVVVEEGSGFEETPQARVAAVLERARASGALERILGERTFRIEQAPGDVLVETVRITRSHDAAALRVDVERRRQADGQPDSEVRRVVLLGLDGRLVARRTTVASAEVDLQEETSGQVEGDVYRLVSTRRDGPAEVDLASDHLPAVAVFLCLAPLFDQGLPDSLHFVDVADPTGALQSYTLASRADGEAQVVRLEHYAGGADGAPHYEARLVRTGPDAGRLLEVRRLGVVAAEVPAPEPAGEGG